MKDDEVNYKVLRKIQQEEKSSPRLTKIDDRFFDDALAYWSMLLNRLENEEKPSRNLILSEQVQNVEKIIRSIYELREKKIMLAAMSKARGGNPSITNFLQSEKELFSTVYAQLIESRDAVLNLQKEKNEEKSVDADEASGDVKKKNPVETIKSSPVPSKNHMVIRVLESIPTFIGTDTKQYDLKKSDIVSVPKNLASMLIQKRVAEPVLMKP